MKRTPLYERYKTYPGVKLIDFGGWELPVQFEAGILAEHDAVRNRAGLFDVSHMGECNIIGEEAASYLDYLCTNSISDMQVGQCRYTLMCYPDGTVVDDLLIYRRTDISFMVVMNASNIEKDLLWITKENPRATECPMVQDISDATVQLALQGPLAVKILSTLVPDCETITSFHFKAPCEVGEVMTIISRTGYTGEDGFELYCAAEDGPLLWDTLLQAGEPFNLTCCGLGSRDTLRMEAKLPLYGHEISDSITPLEANLSSFVKLEKREFCGKEALVTQKKTGIPRSLRGVEMVEKAVPRSGYRVFLHDEDIGYVTSGTKSPTLGIFCAYVLIRRDVGLTFGETVDIEIHRQRKKAKLVKTPFYKHGVKNSQL
ncbi:MAG: glycine cleavage system aminomethyltransferase GcvT [Sphaerochaetaceae bacterium]